MVSVFRGQQAGNKTQVGKYIGIEEHFCSGCLPDCGAESWNQTEDRDPADCEGKDQGSKLLSWLDSVRQKITGEEELQKFCMGSITIKTYTKLASILFPE